MASRSSRSGGREDSKESKPKKKKKDEALVKTLQHFDVFYSQPPPGLVQEEREKPEDCIPDEPENREAREFLAKAPTKGLWMPLGKEVKVMKCWRCKSYGHRTGDRECPLFISGNTQCEQFRFVHEDPMHDFIQQNKKEEREERIKQLQALLNSPSSDSDSSSSSSGNDARSNKCKRRHRSRSPHKSKKAKKSKKHKKHRK
uniref:Zinc knuckle domain-containing protein n=1 Tax=Strigamia maritima TaxID=126957 RepID=T1J279_STRMM